jgi:MYXO-CTERM domain-containing protein
MKLSWNRKMIASATLAVGLLGIGTSVASAQSDSPNRYGDASSYTNRTTESGGRFDWGWLGLLGLFGLLGRRRTVMEEPRGMYERRETYEPRPTR